MLKLAMQRHCLIEKKALLSHSSLSGGDEHPRLEDVAYQSESSEMAVDEVANADETSGDGLQMWNYQKSAKIIPSLKHYLTFEIPSEVID